MVRTSDIANTGDNRMGEEELKQALEVIKSHSPVTRGDSFDIGTENDGSTISTEKALKSPEIINILSNPSQMKQLFDLTDSQAENIRSLIVGGGTGSIHKLLNRHLGDEASAIIGALVSSYAARKLF